MPATGAKAKIRDVHHFRRARPAFLSSRCRWRAPGGRPSLQKTRMRTTVEKAGESADLVGSVCGRSIRGRVLQTAPRRFPGAAAAPFSDRSAPGRFLRRNSLLLANRTVEIATFRREVCVRTLQQRAAILIGRTKSECLLRRPPRAAPPARGDESAVAALRGEQETARNYYSRDVLIFLLP